MGTTLIIVGGAVIFLIAALVAVVAAARARGRAEAESAHNQRKAENAEAMGRVVAEHREPDDAAKRLEGGTF